MADRDLWRFARTRRLGAGRLVCLCACLLACGCHRSSSEGDADAPARLFARLRELHEQHGYKAMESLVDPDRCAVLVDTLMAVDGFLQAGAQLQRAAERLGPTAAVICDIRSLADYLGPFSRKVQIVSTRIEGDTAVVAYQVGERVPVERAEMRWVSGRWRYMPDEPDYELPKLLTRLADRMDALRSEAEAGTVAEQTFIDEYTRQVLTPLQTHLLEAAGQRREQAIAAAQSRP
jgi:hypothetical protein